MEQNNNFGHQRPQQSSFAPAKAENERVSIYETVHVNNPEITIAPEKSGNALVRVFKKQPKWLQYVEGAAAAIGVGFGAYKLYKRIAKKKQTPTEIFEEVAEELNEEINKK